MIRLRVRTTAWRQFLAHKSHPNRFVCICIRRWRNLSGSYLKFFKFLSGFRLMEFTPVFTYSLLLIGSVCCISYLFGAILLCRKIVWPKIHSDEYMIGKTKKFRKKGMCSHKKSTESKGIKTKQTDHGALNTDDMHPWCSVSFRNHSHSPRIVWFYIA